MTRQHLGRASWFLLLLVLSFSASAADTINKVVLQLSDGSAEKQVLVLNVAQNLHKSYGKNTKIEIVAFGPGLPMLLANSPNSKRIQRLASKGIRFSVCRNTISKISKLTGETPQLDPSAIEVEGGAERIIELVNQGYILIRP